MCNKYEGKTVDEAIFRGLNELEISIDEVDVEIVQTETKGVLGIGRKPAIVILKRREMPREFAPEPVQKPRRERPARENRRHDNRAAHEERAVSEPSETAPAEEQGTENFADSAEYQSHGEHRYHERPRRSNYRNNDGFRENRSYNNAPRQEYDYTEEAVAESQAAQFVSELLKNMGIEASVTAANAENEQRVNIVSEESAALLIGKHGETLDAIQYLTALVVNREGGDDRHIKVSVDVDGYRQRRYEKLVRTARAKANMVKSSGRDYSFEPMTAFDRRIIHYALQRNPYVTTHSEGEEPNRYVIITAKRRPRRY